MTIHIQVKRKSCSILLRLHNVGRKSYLNELAFLCKETKKMADPTLPGPNPKQFVTRIFKGCVRKLFGLHRHSQPHLALSLIYVFLLRSRMKQIIFIFNINNVSLKLFIISAKVRLIQTAQWWVFCFFQLSFCIWTQKPHTVHRIISIFLIK